MDSSSCPLESMFLALEQVLPLFRRRRQATLLKQVRPAVEGVCGRSFTKQHLAQIVFVQPGERITYRDDTQHWCPSLTCSLAGRPKDTGSVTARSRAA